MAGLIPRAPSLPIAALVAMGLLPVRFRARTPTVRELRSTAEISRRIDAAQAKRARRAARNLKQETTR